MNLHGVELSPDGRFLVWSTIDAGTPGLRVVSIDHRGGASVSPVFSERTDFPITGNGLPPKGIGFSPDGRLVALAFGANASFGRRRVPHGRVEIREWHDGRLGGLISHLERGMVCPEDVAFHPDGDRLAVVDQIDQRVRILAFDPRSGHIEPDPLTTISWASGGLRLPHACAFSPSGRWLAVANYGDASLRYFDQTAL